MALVSSDLAKKRPDEVALRDDRVALGWGAVDDLLNRAANGMRALDLGPADRVAVFSENCAEAVLAHIAGLHVGVSTVPTNFHVNADELAYMLVDAGVRAVFVGPETAATGLSAARRCGVPLVIGWRCPPTPGLTAWDTWLADASPAGPPVDIAPRPNLMYTSGTTGRPKGVEVPPTMFPMVATVAEFLEAAASTGFARFGTHLVVGPLYHTGPLQAVRLLAVGVPVVVLGRFDAEAVLRAIDGYRTETSVMVPTHFVRLLALADDVRSKYDVSSMKLVGHTGAACPQDVKRRMIEWWGPVLFEAYGATEVGTTCMITSEEWLAHPGSVGLCLPPFSPLIVDDAGNQLPANAEGRLFFVDATGRGIVYPNDPDKTAAAHLRPGTFTLGEIGYVDDDGYVYITDRFSDMIVSGGVNIYPAEAEQVIIQHHQVADVAVIGVPNAEMGEEVKALVVPADRNDPPLAEDLIGWCRRRLAGYKCPRSVEIVESVGRTAMGKINKRQLRAPYWDTGRTIDG